MELLMEVRRVERLEAFSIIALECMCQGGLWRKWNWRIEGRKDIGIPVNDGYKR